MRDLLALTPDELRDTAAKLLPPRGKQGHWSQAALVVGRIHDEDIWRRFVDKDGVLYTSFGEWASEELGLPGDESRTLLKLWGMMRESRDKGIALDRWASIPKSRAVGMRRFLSASHDVPAMFALSDHYENTGDFLRAVRAKLGGKEPWTRITVEAPDEIAQMFEAALVCELPNVTNDPNVTPDRSLDRDLRFQCLEGILSNYFAARTR